jgi:hypothetical protein
MTHVNFIEDTLEYIFTNGKRKIDNVTWSRVITPVLTNPESKINTSDNLDKLITKYIDGGDNIAKTISIWLQRHNGYSDLISTLYIIFGPKDKIFSV